MYEITIDKEACIGCGACAAICASVFEIVDGKAQAKSKKTKEKCAEEASSSCPVNAIKVKAK